MKFGNLSILIAAVALSQAAAAAQLCPVFPSSCALPEGGAVAGPDSRTDKTAFAGLTWEFGGKSGYVPNLVLGVRQLQVHGDNSVNGAELSFSLSVFQRQQLDSVKLGYISGNRDLQAKIGGGYSFEYGTWLATGAIQGAHLAVGSDYLYGVDKFKPYVEISSYERPRAVQGGSNAPLTCAPGFNLVDNIGGYGATPDKIKDGKTCVVFPS